MGITEELDSMIKGLEGQLAKTDPPSTDTIATDPPSTDAPATGAPATDAPTTDAPIDEKDKIIEDLRKQLEDKGKKVTTDAPTTDTPLQLDPQDFIGDADLEDAFSSKESVNSLLNLVYQRGIADAKKVLTKHFSGIIPQVVQTNLEVTEKIKKIHDDFYDTNKDLIPWKKTVATVFDELVASNPTKKFDEILGDVSTEVRKRLGLKKPDANNNDKGEKPPRLPNRKGRSQIPADDKPKTMADEIEEMNKVLGR